MIDAETPAPSVEAPIEAARTSIRSVEVDCTVTSSAAVTREPAPMYARTSLVTTETTTPAPIPAEPVEAPTPPAPSATSVPSLATTERLWSLPAATVPFWFTSTPGER